MGRAVELRLAGEAQAQFARVGLGENHKAGGLEPPHQLAIFRRRDIGEEAAAARGADAAERAVEVFQEIGNAGEGTGRQSGLDRGPAVIVERHDHGVERGVEPLDLRHRHVQQLPRAHLTRAYQFGEGKGIEGFVFRHEQRFSPSWSISGLAVQKLAYYKIIGSASSQGLKPGRNAKNRYLNAPRGA